MIPQAPPWFEQELRFICDRLRLVWAYWQAAREDQAGDTIWSPFGPPMIRASNSLGAVGIRIGGGQWMLVPPDRVTTGRWCVFEEIDGQKLKVFDICDADSGPIELDRRTLEACRECMTTVEERMRLIEAQYKEAQIDVPTTTQHGADGSLPVPKVVYRNKQQQAWREAAEAQIGDTAAYEYARSFSHYQHDPSKEPKGERHPAGFIVVDHRASQEIL